MAVSEATEMSVSFPHGTHLGGQTGYQGPERGASTLRAGAQELTMQERRVAAIVARGATNNEAAAQLFISAKTVEFHLGHVYRKLGVRSRTELAHIWPQVEAFGPRDGRCREPAPTRPGARPTSSVGSAHASADPKN